MSVIYGFIERDNSSLDGTPLGQPSGRDAPSISILQSNTVSSKNEIYSKLLKILYSFSCDIKYSQINSKIIRLMFEFLLLIFWPEYPQETQQKSNSLWQ